jgi:uncharacterized protein YacL
MPCTSSCLLATALIISMIYFQNATSKSKIVKEYKKQLPANLQNLYDKITSERLRICLYGYVLGFILSLIIILYNYNLKHNKLTTTSMVCITVVVTFFTNYFYYILSPKSDWMLRHINSPEQTKAWLAIYRGMQINYHVGLVLGIVAVGVLAFAFRC